MTTQRQDSTRKRADADETADEQLLDDVLEDAGPRGTGRRRFLTYLVAAPTLTVATRIGLDSRSPAAAVIPQPADIIDLGDLLILAGAPTQALLARLEITDDGRAVLDLPRGEVGQGITTAFAMLVADELDLPLDSVDVTLADARPELLLNQLTGGSNTVRSMYGPVRSAAASARGRMVAAAAQEWQTSPDGITVEDGVVVGPDGRRATYGELTRTAAAASLPNLKARAKKSSEFDIVGTPTGRIDARLAVTGQIPYGTDVEVEGAMPVMVSRPPTMKGRPVSFNRAQVLAMPGVLGAEMIETGVAIMAETFGQALDAKQAVEAEWTKGTIDGLSDEDIFAKLRGATPPFTVPPLGDLTVEGEFDFHSVSHAPLEPNSAVADVRADRAEIWASAKSPIVAAQTIAAELGLPQDKVTFHVQQGGGSFGRRLFFDAALEAARASKAFGRPVRLLWTRIDDMRHGRARASSHHKLRITSLLNQPIAYEQRVASIETDFRHGLGEILTAVAADIPIAGPVGFSQTVFLTTVKCPYNFGAVTQLLNEVPLDMHTGSWRSVYSSSARGAEEILVDELAARTGQDPYELRRSKLENGRQRAVLDRAAELGEWGKAMPRGFGQGIAFHEEYKSCTAIVVELDGRDPQDPRVTRATIVADVGLCLNPTGLEGQLLGGLTDAIGTTLRAGLHIRDGLPLEGSYSQFHYTRQADSPTDVTFDIIDSGDEPGGAGELGVPAAVGAIANAYARATGTKPRSFPIIFPVDFEPFPPQ